MNKNTQYGKGLFGFFFGLILATGVIGGILYFLNQDTPNAFKGATEPQKQQTEPEILKPQEKSKPEPKPETEEQPVVVPVEKERPAEEAKPEQKRSEADDDAAAKEKERADKEAKEKADKATGGQELPEG